MSQPNHDDAHHCASMKAVVDYVEATVELHCYRRDEVTKKKIINHSADD